MKSTIIKVNFYGKTLLFQCTTYKHKKAKIKRIDDHNVNTDFVMKISDVILFHKVCKYPYFRHRTEQQLLSDAENINIIKKGLK